MLATLSPRMEPPRVPPSPSSSLLRQPSAEDLDAAQQLVSSARSARDGSIDSGFHRSSTETDHGRARQDRRLSQESQQEVSNEVNTKTRESQSIETNARNASRPSGMKRSASTTNNVHATSPAAVSRRTSASPSAPTANNPRPLKTPYVPPEHSSGTCPGGGKCNGAGGAEGCDGCPAFNNRVAKSTTNGRIGAPSPSRISPSASAQEDETGDEVGSRDTDVNDGVFPSEADPSLVVAFTQQFWESRPPPPAVDFTGYNYFQHTPPASQNSRSPQSQKTRPRKKRSVSSMSQASELSANQPANDESPVDPSLLALSQRAHQNQSQARGQPPRPQPAEQDENESRKAERRAQLAREAEQMRGLLMAKERELAELA
ncbi:MAG: hypothetical protein Q9160_001669 [Pyrenula sp. 1 TL-2023]